LKHFHNLKKKEPVDPKKAVSSIKNKPSLIEKDSKKKEAVQDLENAKTIEDIQKIKDEDLPPMKKSGTWAGSKMRTAQASAVEKCHTCGKIVYLTERISADEKIFHKGCLKCSHCNCVLKLGNYASLQGKTYCKPHFKQLFNSKGNYSEGFGEEKLTAKWGPTVIQT